MRTIATAKVQRNYNCYNVYFNECLLSFLFSSERWGSCSVVNACLKLLYYAI